MTNYLLCGNGLFQSWLNTTKAKNILGIKKWENFFFKNIYTLTKFSVNISKFTENGFVYNLVSYLYMN